MSVDILDFAVGSARGRRQATTLSFLREIGEEDKEELLLPEPKGSENPPIRKMRDTHHALARLLAEGRKGVEAAGILGLSQSWVSILKNDPAFQELLSYYRSQKEAIYLDVHARMARLGLDAVSEIHERLLTDPENFELKELLAIVELTADRSFAPQKGKAQGQGGGEASGPVVVNINFTKGQEVSVDPLPRRTLDVTDLEPLP